MTGGTGYVGEGLRAGIISRGSTTTIISRKKIKSTSAVKWIEFDMSKDAISRIKEELKECTILILNAANKSTDESNKDLIHQTNIHFLENVLGTVNPSVLKKILFTSSVGAIKRPLPSSITEESETFIQTQYHQSKLLSEKIIKEFAVKNNIKYYIFRISSPIRTDASVLPDNVLRHWITSAKEGRDLKVHGAGERTQDYVSVSDISMVYCNCINSEFRAGLYNIAAGDTIPMLEIAKLVAKKYKVKILHEGTDLNEEERWNISIEKARKHLNYNPKFSSREAIESFLKLCK